MSISYNTNREKRERNVEKGILFLFLHFPNGLVSVLQSFAKVIHVVFKTHRWCLKILKGYLIKNPLMSLISIEKKTEHECCKTL